MSESVNARESAAKALCRISAWAKSANNTTTNEWEIAAKCSLLQETWQRFCLHHDAVLGVCGKDSLQLQLELFSPIEEAYCSTRAALNRLSSVTVKSRRQESEIASESRLEVSAIQALPNTLSLPKVSIPTFCDGYVEWQSFADLYTVLIHDNEQLSNVQKFHYLRSSLSGEAAQIISHITITEANYEVAWESLRERYTNQRVITSVLIDKLINQPASSESVSDIKRLLDTTQQTLQMLSNLNRPTAQWDDIIVHIIANKLSTQSRHLWETSIADTRDPATWQRLQTFLTTRFRTLEASGGSKLAVQSTGASSKAVSSKKHTVNNITILKCTFCGEPHHLYRCSKFASASIIARREHVRQKQICYNCLQHGHSVESCPSNRHCRKCKKAHHTLLHQDTTPTHTQSRQTPVPQSTHESTNQPEMGACALPQPTASTSQQMLTSHIVESNSNATANTYGQQTIVLATAQVRATSNTGTTTNLRVLIDQGSQISLITERAAQMLQLKRDRSCIEIVGVGQNSTLSPNGSATVQLSSTHDNNRISATVYILPSITTMLPSAQVRFEYNINLPSPLADPLWHQPKHIDVLLGADTYCRLIQPGVQKLNESLVAQNTIFGWILSGQLSTNIVNSHHICSHTVTADSVDKLLRRFWEINDESCNEHSVSGEIKFIEQHFDETHERLPSGRYQVRLPFKSLMTGTAEVLGDSFSAAVSRLYQVERRFQRNPELQQEYIQFMDTYENLCHMEELSHDEIYEHRTGMYYLPHHSVVKESSTTTKVRVVFDGTHTLSSGVSLNDTLLIGPTLQPKLADTLLRWRNHRIAICADIKQMYRQILVHPDDQHYQRIVWRRSTSDPVRHYKLRTVTYGTSAAPYLAVRALRQLAVDEHDAYPNASRVTLSDFYVDDLLSGGDEVATVIQLRSELKALMQAGCMELVKWASNNDAVLETIPESERRCQFPLSLNGNETISTLGIVWEPADDTFTFKIDLNETNKDFTTKRQLLSQASRLFDPIGWLEPVTIVPKLMMQKLWLLKLNWDDRIPESMHRDWCSFKTKLQQLSKVKIHRWTGFTTNKRYQLHGFSDASTLAYAAVVYLRVENDNNEDTTVAIIAARSRVSPIKTVSIPRLELCGATLLADLMQHIIGTMFATTAIETFAWCDSQVTLAWLKSSPCRWKVFIANRTSQIISKLPNCKFAYVPSAENPADLASRGICPSKLPQNSLWFNGPRWLSKSPNEWPSNIREFDSTMIQLEERISSNAATVITEWDLLSRYSTLTRLVRIMARSNRFINRIRRKGTSNLTFLTSSELSEALQLLVLYTQRTYFPEWNQAFKHDRQLLIRGELTALAPFIDSQGVIRVGGRLRRAELSYSQRHPIILPRRAQLTSLIVKHAHHRTLHGNVQLMLNTLRSQYWIIGARSAVKQIIHSCTICTRIQAKITTPFMGDLPASRINPSHPFTHSAIDYAGPISTKASHGRGRKQIIKGYISVFVCLATKAIHLEAVTELTSLAFIAAFRRFISRRGKCSNVYSDCGTNFVGAYRIMNEYRSIANQAAPTFAEDGITWHFSPPGAPHFNGLAEAGVKSVKRHLSRVVGNVTLTYEELATTLCQIEACLNSRPLCALRDDPSHLDVLTPGHFLIGRPPLLPPEPSYLAHQSLATRWHIVQQLVQSFWKQWQQEYLTELQRRSKWDKSTPPVRVGDIVLIKEDNLPPLKWSLGKITQLHPGSDGVIRVVTLRTASAVMKRPVVKICILPIDSANT